MTKLAFSFHSCGLSIAAPLLFLLLAATVSMAAVQSSEDVHIVPNEASRGIDLRSNPGRSEVASGPNSSLFSVDVDLVLVPVLVTDGVNRPVTGLKPGNFEVYEDKRLQQIRYFSTEDAPISVGIILDLSGTMSKKIDAAREALREFFKNSHPEDDYFVITFADHPQLLADSTQSIGEIEGKLATVKPYGYTALLDAIYMGLNKLRSARCERRALLIISDGGDNSSRHSLRQIKSIVEESDVEVYAIGIFNDGMPLLKSLDEAVGKRILTQVTEASGGRTLTVENLANLPEIAATVSRELRSRYLLGYKPAKSAQNGTWRKIAVRVQPPISKDVTKLRLHPSYKKGYTARPEY